MKETVLKKVDDIAVGLRKLIEEEKLPRSNRTLSLIGGDLGILIFFSYYNKYKQDEDFARFLEKYTEEYIDKLSSGVPSLTYASGLSGILAGLKSLNDSGLLSLDYSDLEVYYRGFLLNNMGKEFDNENFDFLHGALGTALYYTDDPEFTAEAVSHLEKNAIKDGNTLKWKGSLGLDKPKGFNISLSHGFSSIVVYLSRIYGKHPELNQRIDALLDGTVNYILSQEIDPGRYKSYFPSQSIDNGTPPGRSRIAWCYGDMGVCVGLWQAAKKTENEGLKRKVKEVMEFTAKRNDPVSENVHDAGICHGSAGLSMVYRYFHDQFEDERYKRTADYWQKISIEKARFEGAVGGYKIHRANEDPNWVDNYYLLEGTSGTGLELLASVSDNSFSQWMSLFLLENPEV